MKGCALLAAAAICGCGRVGFDPLGDGAIGGDDAPAGGSDASGSGTSDGPMPDGMPAACAEAIEVFAGTPHRSTTCTGMDRIDGCGPQAAEEVVYKWVVPANGTYTISAVEVPSGNVVIGTGRVNAACTSASMCTGVSAMPYTVGQVLYFALEANSGCLTNDFTITTN